MDGVDNNDDIPPGYVAEAHDEDEMMEEAEGLAPLVQEILTMRLGQLRPMSRNLNPMAMMLVPVSVG